MEEENVSAMKIYQWAKEGQYEFAFSLRQISCFEMERKNGVVSYAHQNLI